MNDSCTLFLYGTLLAISIFQDNDFRPDGGHRPCGGGIQVPGGVDC
ncbi:MAG: hypothetical protein ACK43N_16045 [Pirellulaceae bacterium]